MPSGVYPHERKVTKITIDEAYEQLRAAILLQAISDYWLTSKALAKFPKEKAKANKERLLHEVNKFFLDPPYDYGDVDTRRVKLMLDVAAEEGFDLRINSNTWRYE